MHVRKPSSQLSNSRRGTRKQGQEEEERQEERGMREEERGLRGHGGGGRESALQGIKNKDWNEEVEEAGERGAEREVTGSPKTLWK